MDFWEKNQELLEKYRPDFAERLKERSGEAREKDPVEVETLVARNGLPILQVTRDGKAYRINSAYRPVEEGEKWAAQFEIKTLDQVFFLCGMANGYVVDALLKKLPQDAALIVYEPSIKVWENAMASYDISSILGDKRVLLTVKDINWDFFEGAIDRTLNWMNMNSMIVTCHPQYEKAFAEDYDAFSQKLFDGYAKVHSNINTAVKFQKVWAPNTLFSMSTMKHNNLILDLENKLPTDVPAIIVAAGPSLDKNIELLRQAKGKAYIIACDKVIPQLLKRDIIPDFLITIDARKWPAYFKNERCHEIPMFCLFEANRKIVERHTGRKFFFDSSEYPKAFFMMMQKRTTSFNSGGSVATAAFTVCAALNFKTVIMIGQDLAYGEEGKTHMGGMRSGEHDNGGEVNHRWVEGIHGEQVLTRSDWYMYLDWFNNAVKQMTDIHVVDATEGGAKIEGTEIITFQEAIDKYCTKEVDVQAIVDSIPPTLNDKEYEALIDYVQISLQDLTQIRKKLEKGIENCKKLEKACYDLTVDEPRYNKMIKELGQTNAFVESKGVYMLLDSMVAKKAKDDLEGIYEQLDDRIENLIKTFQQSGAFYKTLLDAARELDPMLEETVQRLKEAE